MRSNIFRNMQKKNKKKQNASKHSIPHQTYEHRLKPQLGEKTPQKAVKGILFDIKGMHNCNRWL